MIITDLQQLKIPCRNTTIKECTELGIFLKLDAELAVSVPHGLGLAANQISFPIRACTIHPKEKEKYEITHMINPRVYDLLLPIVSQGEGCLSIPGVRLNTNRFEQCTCTWLDYELGEEVTVVFFGLPAIVVQHEYDHTIGKTIFDRAVRTNMKVGRNDPCPNCKEVGISIKWKKCRMHNK